MDKLCEKNIPKYFYRLLFAVILILGITVIIKLQFQISTLHDADGYLHIRMAEIIRQTGPIHDFHWAKFSIFDKNFADKDFLFHLILIPFSFGANLLIDAKWAIVFLAMIFFIVFLIITKKYLLPSLTIAVFLCLFLSDKFVGALNNCRPMILVITLTLLGIHFLIKKQLWGVFIITAIYSLTHVSGPYMLFYALIIEIIRRITEKQFYSKSILITFLGIIFAYLIHPNFPHNFLVFYLNAIIVPLYAVKWGLELGAEFFPISTREFLLSYPVIIIGLATIFFIALFKRPQTQFATKAVLTIAGAFLCSSLLSERYFIHTYPLFLLGLGMYLTDYFQYQPLTKRKIFLIPSAIFICLIAGLIGLRTAKSVTNNALNSELVNLHYQRASAWMDKNIPAGETVFHTNWSDSQYFIGLSPQHNYLVTLDPTYMYWWNPEIYNLYRAISFGQVQDPYTPLKEVFKIKYGYAGKNYFSGLINQIRQDDKLFEILYEDNLGVIFALK